MNNGFNFGTKRDVCGTEWENVERSLFIFDVKTPSSKSAV